MNTFIVTTFIFAFAGCLIGMAVGNPVETNDFETEIGLIDAPRRHGNHRVHELNPIRTHFEFKTDGRDRRELQDYLDGAVDGASDLFGSVKNGFEQAYEYTKDMAKFLIEKIKDKVGY